MNEISIKLRLTCLLLLFCLTSMAQLVDGNGYMLGDYVEVAIDGGAGHEGTADIAGSHSRGGGTVEIPFGFVADNMSIGWDSDDYNGDFFAAGSPENGFGVEINGINYSNNGWNQTTITPFLQEIPQAPGTALAIHLMVFVRQ